MFIIFFDIDYKFYLALIVNKQIIMEMNIKPFEKQQSLIIDVSRYDIKEVTDFLDSHNHQYKVVHEPNWLSYLVIPDPIIRRLREGCNMPERFLEKMNDEEQEQELSENDESC